jgi:hypothetical protein
MRSVFVFLSKYAYALPAAIALYACYKILTLEYNYIGGYLHLLAAFALALGAAHSVEKLCARHVP